MLKENINIKKMLKEKYKCIKTIKIKNMEKKKILK